MDVINDLQDIEIYGKAYSFKVFDMYGYFLAETAIIFIDEGLLRPEEISVPPMTQVLTVIHLTEKGRMASENFVRVWDKGYQPIMEKTEAKFIDEYLDPEPDLEFALSLTRLEAERKAGRLSKVISICPSLT